MAINEETRESLPPPNHWLALVCLNSGAEAEKDAGFQKVRGILQAVTDSFPLSMLIKDREGRRVFANRGYYELMSVEEKVILNKTDFDLYPEEQARILSGEDAQVLRTGQELLAADEISTLDGEALWIERLKRPLRDAAGNVVGVQVLFWDSTARHKIQLAHDLERDLLHSLMDNIPDSIYYKDDESRFMRISRSMLEKFGFESTDDIIGKTDADIFTDVHAQQAFEDEMEIIRTGHPLVARLERETWPDRDDTWVSTTKMPLRNGQGEIVGTFGISRDVTELKRTQDELQVARDAASAASQAKSDFLANVSHEIRTPMNGILGMTDLLLNTELTDEQYQYQTIVRESAEVLLGLLNSILDFSKIEAGKFELEQVPFQLRETLGATLQTLAARAAQKGLELAVRIPSDVPENLFGDPVRLRQILINLVGNAIKFTDQGEIVVEVVVESIDSAESQLLFSVRDTGIGIPQELQDSVFAAFRQADTSTTRKFGGTGLGLAISSELVSMMKGKIWVESQAEKGSTFFFTAHFLRAPESPRIKPAAWETLHQLPVLIVDDNQTNRTILHEIISEWGLSPSSVGSGREAIASMQESAEKGAPYRLLLLDVMMPEMGGLELFEELHRLRLIESTVVIILSSADRASDSKRAKELGAASCLVKPVSQSDLFDAISIAFDAASVDEKPANNLIESRPKDFVARRILLVEDGIVNQKVAVSLLEKRGHSVTVANNGAEGVEKNSSGQFDLILMDVQMPVMDGIEATAAIRKSESGSDRHMPIIAITAHAIKGDRQRCLDVGMDDYVSKPFRAKELFAKVERITNDAPVAPTTIPSPNDQSAIVRATGPVTSHSRAPKEDQIDELPYDHKAAMLSVDGDEGLLSEMASLFLQECPQQMAEIAQAYTDGDAKSLSRAAHTMKGSAALFGAERVREIAFRIEKMGANDDLEEYDDAWRLLNEETEKLLAALQRLCE